MRLVYKGGSLDCSRPCLMGILNVTPDSFSDGGQFLGVEAAVHHAATLAAEGAEIIDVGAESTRPGHQPLDAEEEIARLAPVLAALDPASLPPISIDTTKASVAAYALERGAVIVNDIWGFSRDPDLVTVAAEHEAACVLMHNRSELDDSLNIVAEMIRFFETSLARTDKAGIPRERIALDPGIGFGKTLRQNLVALGSAGHLARHFECSVLVGASRKSFIDKIDPSPVSKRLGGTLAAHLHAVKAGAHILRVHDVAPHRQALAVMAAIEAEPKAVMS